MFEYLYGMVDYKKLDYIALDINGVGYKVYISLREYENLEIGKKYKFFIYNHIREDINKLIGFLNMRDRKLFEQLLKIKGIGVSLALAILSTFSYDKIVELITNEDYKNLKRVPKLGEKKAQLIILELRSKLKDIGISEISKNYDSEMLDDLVLALESLGYNEKEINKILSKNDISKFFSVEDAIKEILKQIKA